MNKTFEEIRKEYIARYPHLADLKSDGDFARAAIALATRDMTTIHDLVLLARVAGSSALQDKDTLDDLIEWGKENGY